MLCLNSMIDQALKKDAALTMLLGGEFIYEFHEAGDRKVQYPRVIFEEISNVPGLVADNVEAASRITYRISVCAEDNVTAIANAMERVMLSLNFARHSAEPIRDMPIGIKGKVFVFVTTRECD